MKPAPFVRHVPKTIDEALRILAEVAPHDGRVLAGGQSLVPIMAFRLAKPAHLVDINEVAGLDKIGNDGTSLTIAARVRHAAFHKPEGTLLCSRNALSADFSRIISLIEEGRIDTRPWITHRAAFDELIDVFPSYTRPETGVIKAVVEVGE